MTRKEEIEQVSDIYSTFNDGTIKDAYAQGARWADRTMLDKAEEWLRSEMERRFNDETGKYEMAIFTGGEFGEKWIERFREAMN